MNGPGTSATAGLTDPATKSTLEPTSESTPASPGVSLTATSHDGRTFGAHVPLGAVQLGDLVVLEPATASPLLGQVFEAQVDGGIRGRILGDVTSGRPGRGPLVIFAEAPMRTLTPDELERFQAATGADLTVGQWRVGAVDAPLRLRSRGFNRHTFLCGQSGSGKTYALGVILEQLILETALPLIVLDPNGDYVHLGDPREEAPAGPAAAIRAADTEVLHGGGSGADALHVRFVDLPRPAQAAVLQLDPLRDRGEYSHWLHLELNPRTQHIQEVIAELLRGTPEGRALGQRIENLGVGTWDIWPGTLQGSLPTRESRVTVLDLMGFQNEQEVLVAALDVVERLWRDRDGRQPTLIVIDEAHNICPAVPTSPLQHALTERLIQIAAEGRKYGIWLLLSTQRPSKVHPQIVSQCDNLVLMRMNSPSDISELGRLFGFVPPAMLDASPYFAQGELLLAGAFVPVPTQGRVGERITVEGGSDVNVPLP